MEATQLLFDGRLITFDNLKLQESYIPLLKVLVCGMNTSSPKWCGYIFTLCYTHLKLALLLHKTVLKMFLLGSTVWSYSKKFYLYCWYLHSSTYFSLVNHVEAFQKAFQCKIIYCLVKNLLSKQEMLRNKCPGPVLFHLNLDKSGKI